MQAHLNFKNTRLIKENRLFSNFKLTENFWLVNAVAGKIPLGTRDCVNGGANCNNTSNPGFNPNDTVWNHGTSTAAILSVNSRLGNAYRGVTGVLVDSWQIYTNTGLDSGAAIRAIQNAVAAYDKVLVGEMQANESETGAIASRYLEKPPKT